MWWIDAVIDRWNILSSNHPDHNARLCGFAWTKASLDQNDEEILKLLHVHLKAKKLMLIWCTNYGTNKAETGKEIGFDAVFIRPTYMNTKDRNVNWLDSATQFSKVIPTDIIIWGDERVSKNQLLDFLNFGRHSFSHAKQIFELNGRSVYEFYKNGDPRYVYLYAYIKNAYTYIPT